MPRVVGYRDYASVATSERNRPTEPRIETLWRVFYNFVE